MPENALHSVVGIAQGHVALLLALTGLHVEEVTNASEAEEILADYLERDVEIIVLQEELQEGFSTLMQERLANHRGAPLVAECPSFEEADSEVDAYLSAVLKPAIGYEMRLE